MKANTRLRVLRAERNVSQMEVAARAGITTHRYWKIENGYAQAKPAERRSIARAFKVPEADAFPEPEAKAS